MDTSSSESETEELPRGNVPDSDAEAVSQLLRKIGEGEVDPQYLLKRVCHEPDSKARVDKPDEDQMSTLANIALDKLERTGDVTRAVSIALREHEEDIDGDREQVMGQVAQKVHESLPDQFEYELVYHTSLGMGIAVETGCPECGHDKVFNGSVTHSPAQFVAMTVDEEELQNLGESAVGEITSLCFIDDADVSIDHLTCGVCGAVLEEE
jgi:hypothetical protein